MKTETNKKLNGPPRGRLPNFATQNSHPHIYRVCNPSHDSCIDVYGVARATSAKLRPAPLAPCTARTLLTTSQGLPGAKGSRYEFATKYKVNIHANSFVIVCVRERERERESESFIRIFP